MANDTALAASTNGNALRRALTHPATLAALRLVLAAVFIYAALQKIGRPLLFADEIRAYGVVDYGAPLYVMAVVLPWLELVCGAALVTGIALRGAALVLACLNALFIAVIAYRAVVLSRAGTPFFQVFFDCGCGFDATYAWKKLIEDAALLAASLVLLLAPAHRYTVPLRRRSS